MRFIPLILDNDEQERGSVDGQIVLVGTTEMHDEEDVSVLVGVVDVGLSVVVWRDSEDSLFTTVEKVVKVVDKSVLTVDEESGLEAG